MVEACGPTYSRRCACSHERSPPVTWCGRSPAPSHPATGTEPSRCVHHRTRGQMRPLSAHARARRLSRSHIVAPSFPATHPAMAVVLVLRVEYTEALRTVDLGIDLTLDRQPCDLGATVQFATGHAPDSISGAPTFRADRHPLQQRDVRACLAGLLRMGNRSGR